MATKQRKGAVGKQAAASSTASRASGVGTAAKSASGPASIESIAAIEALLEVMERRGATELEIEHEDGARREKIVLRRGTVVHASAASYAPAPIVPSAHAAPAVPSPTAAVDSDAGHSFVHCPLVGTFYRAPGPDAPSFVDVGTVIRPGQRLCIVEAMKLMNEIESEIEGTIVEILVENGKPVEYGQKLFKVKK